MFRFISILCITSVFLGCSSLPDFEIYALSEASIKAAEKRGAHKYDGTRYQKALSHWRWGQMSFKKKDYKVAHRHFKKAREYAEKAEIRSYLKKSFDKDALH